MSALELIIVILVVGWIVAVVRKKPRLQTVVLAGIPLAMVILVFVALLGYLGSQTTNPQPAVVLSNGRPEMKMPPPPWQWASQPVENAAKASDDKPPTDKKKNESKADEATPAADRPDWLDAPPGKVGDGYQMVVTAGPYTTRMECDEALLAPLRAAAAEYAALYLGPEADGRATLSDAFLDKHVVREQWEETKTTSVGPMVELHARLVFDAKANDQLKQSLHDAVVLDRLWQAGRVAAAVLVALAGALALLKTDSATARLGLVLAVAVVVVAVLVVG